MYPHTPERHVLYAPQKNVVFFFFGVNDDKFTELSPECFLVIEKSDVCLSYIWGEFQPPARSARAIIWHWGKAGS